MLVSVVINTYNNPGHLARALAAYPAQTYREFEMLIADDGSRDDTRAVVRDFRERSGLRVRHVWHEDIGFRRSRIINKCIAAARGEYIICTDGDCLPRPEWIEMHVRMSRSGRFLGGADCRLPQNVTDAIRAEDITSGRMFRWSWLRDHGMPRDKRILKVVPPPWLGRLMDATNVSPARWSGSNGSTWKADLVRVNGFDERFRSWGKEDHELAVRLWNVGMRSRHIRYSAVTYHLDHGRPYFDQAKFEANLAILRESITTKATRARVGIAEAGDDHTIEERTPTRAHGHTPLVEPKPGAPTITR